jgi:hypothetical protein
VLWREALLGGAKGYPVPVSSTALLIGFVLSIFLTREGTHYRGDPATVARLAEAAYVSERTVKRGLAELVTKGYLIRVERGRAGRATKYRTSFPDRAEGATSDPLADLNGDTGGPDNGSRVAHELGLPGNPLVDDEASFSWESWSADDGEQPF